MKPLALTSPAESIGGAFTNSPRFTDNRRLETPGVIRHTLDRTRHAATLGPALIANDTYQAPITFLSLFCPETPLFAALATPARPTKRRPFSGLNPLYQVILAERGGFEPPERFNPFNGLANRRFRPLSHLSTPHFRQPAQNPLLPRPL